MSWQPIETAPLDGTSVLLFVPEWNQPVTVAWYVVTETRDHGVVTFSKEYWATGTWISGLPAPKPSHWQPLPKPPSDI